VQSYWLVAVAAGLASGFLYLAPLATGIGGLPLALTLSQFAPLPLFLVGLSSGATAAAAAGAVACLATLAFGTFTAAVLFAAIAALPAAVLSRHALLSRPLPDGGVEWYPAGYLLCWLLALAGGALLLGFVWFALSGDGLVGALRQAADRFFDAVEGDGLDTIPPETRAAFDGLLPFVPGLFATVNALMVALNGILAQRLLLRFGKARRAADRLSELELPRSLGLLLLGGIVAAMLPGTMGHIGASLAMLLTVAYFLAGLAVIHALARGSAGRRGILTVFYALLTVLLLLATPLAVLVAAVGVLDQLIGLRRRIRGGGANRKE